MERFLTICSLVLSAISIWFTVVFWFLCKDNLVTVFSVISLIFLFVGSFFAFEAD